MAIHVVLIKESEDENEVIYRFGPDESRLGKIKFNKKTKEGDYMMNVPNTETNFYYFRALYTLTKIAEQPDHIFPDRTFFAS